jgi:hypothetical protein
VDLYAFFTWWLVVIAAVTLAWPVNIPLVALAYRVRLGTQPPPVVEGLPLWWRFTLAALGLAGMSVLTLGLLYLLAVGAGFPPGPIRLILLVGYLPAAVAFLYWMLALEDLLQATGLLVLYILMPGLPLLLIGRSAGWWEGLRQSAPWLLSSS